jgi:hypothetical protein
VDEKGGGCALEEAAGPIPRGERMLKSCPSAFGGPYVLKGSGMACTIASKQGSELFAVNLSKTSKEERTTTASWGLMNTSVSLSCRHTFSYLFVHTIPTLMLVLQYILVVAGLQLVKLIDLRLENRKGGTEGLEV